MDQGEDIHPFGSTGEKNLGAFIHRRARRIDVVDEKNPLLFHLFFILKKKCPPHSLFSLHSTQTDLGNRRPSFFENLLSIRNPQPAAYLLGQKKRLIEPALPQALRMERNGNDKIKKIGPPMVREAFCHPFAEKRSDVNLPLILPAVNGFSQGPFIVS